MEGVFQTLKVVLGVAYSMELVAQGMMYIYTSPLFLASNVGIVHLFQPSVPWALSSDGSCG